MKSNDVAVLLPALDEEDAVIRVLRSFQDSGARVIVVDNGSRDATASRAASAGAEVVRELRRGYGSACLAGLEYLESHEPPRYVVFSDCDGSVTAADLPHLLTPLRDGTADLVLGCRVAREPGAYPPHQRVGNWSLVLLLRALFGVRVRDLSPYRALRWSLVKELALRDGSYGLPLETVARAALHRARIAEVDVALYRRHGGRSKVSGTAFGTLRASARMFSLGLRLRIDPGGRV